MYLMMCYKDMAAFDLDTKKKTKKKIGACMYLMMRYKDGAAFDVDNAAREALDVVQRGYNTRPGEDGGGSLSPETEEQRQFVYSFARELYAQYGLNSAF